MDIIQFTNNDIFNYFATLFFALTVVVAPVFAVFEVIRQG